MSEQLDVPDSGASPKPKRAPADQRGLLVVYTGHGKGKTTAAAGITITRKKTLRARRSRTVAEGVVRTMRRTANRASIPAKTLAVGTTTTATTSVWIRRIDRVRTPHDPLLEVFFFLFG